VVTNHQRPHRRTNLIRMDLFAEIIAATIDTVLLLVTK
jgi:hypothetical protein